MELLTISDETKHQYLPETNPDETKHQYLPETNPDVVLIATDVQTDIIHESKAPGHSAAMNPPDTAEEYESPTRKPYWKSRKIQTMFCLIAYFTLSAIFPLIFCSLQADSDLDTCKKFTASVNGAIGASGGLAIWMDITRFYRGRQTTTRHTLLKYASLMHFVGGVTSAVGSSPIKNQFLCPLQALFLGSKGTAVILTTVITLHAYMVHVRNVRVACARDTSLILGFTLCFLFISFRFNFISRNNDRLMKNISPDDWCSTSKIPGGVGLYLFYIPIICFIVISAALLVLLIRRRRQILKEKNVQKIKISNGLILITIMYQSIEIVVWVLAVANRTASFFEQPNDQLSVLQAALTPAVGFYTFVVYILCDSPTVHGDKGDILPSVFSQVVKDLKDQLKDLAKEKNKWLSHRDISNIGDTEAGGNFSHSATAKLNGETVFVKIPKSGMDDSDFYEEALVCLELDHPNIVKLKGICLDMPQFNDVPGVLIFEYYNGNLKTFWETTDNKCYIEILTQMAEAIGYLHSEQYVHGDIALRNFLVKKTGDGFHVSLADFGLTKQLGCWPSKYSPPDGPEELLFCNVVFPDRDIFSFAKCAVQMLIFCIEESWPFIKWRDRGDVDRALQWLCRECDKGCIHKRLLLTECLLRRFPERPAIEDVLESLKGENPKPSRKPYGSFEDVNKVLLEIYK